MKTRKLKSYFFAGYTLLQVVKSRPRFSCKGCNYYNESKIFRKCTRNFRLVGRCDPGRTDGKEVIFERVNIWVLSFKIALAGVALWGFAEVIINLCKFYRL